MIVVTFRKYFCRALIQSPFFLAAIHVFFIFLIFACRKFFLSLRAEFICMVNNRLRQPISLLMLFVLVGYIVFTTMFSHVHFFGRISIVHSHPYSSENHTHPFTVCNTIASLSQFLGTDVIIDDYSAPDFTFFVLPFLEYECFAVHAPRFFISLRAPPFN